MFVQYSSMINVNKLLVFAKTLINNDLLYIKFTFMGFIFILPVLFNIYAI